MKINPTPGPQLPQRADKPPVADESDAAPAEPKDGFSYTASRAGGVLLGGALGTSKAAVGAFQGLSETRYDHQASPKVVRTARLVGASGTAFLGAHAGYGLAGIPGAVAGLVVGGAVGGVLGNAAVGAGEAVVSMTHGAIDQGWKGALSGAQLGGQLVDKAFGKE